MIFMVFAPNKNLSALCLKGGKDTNFRLRLRCSLVGYYLIALQTLFTGTGQLPRSNSPQCNLPYAIT